MTINEVLEISMQDNSIVDKLNRRTRLEKTKNAIRRSFINLKNDLNIELDCVINARCQPLFKVEAVKEILKDESVVDEIKEALKSKALKSLKILDLYIEACLGTEEEETKEKEEAEEKPIEIPFETQVTPQSVGDAVQNIMAPVQSAISNFGY